MVIQNNDAVDGAMSLISSSQVLIESETHLNSIANTGRYSNLFSLTEKPVIFADLVQPFHHYLAPFLKYLSITILIHYASLNILILSYLHYNGM